MRSVALVFAGLIAWTPASAAVTSSDQHSFTVEQSIVLFDRPTTTWKAFVHVEDVWSDSVRASNEMLGPFRRGSWCEKPRHGRTQCMRVVGVRDGEEIVFSGALSPLNFGRPARMVARFTPEG